LNGEDPTKHRVLLRAGDFMGINFNTNGCRARGFEIHDAGVGVGLYGANNIVEDCLIARCNLGLHIYGGNARANVLRRCTLMQCFTGMNVGDGPGTHLFEDNLILGTGYYDLQSFAPSASLNAYAYGVGVRFGDLCFSVVRNNIVADGVSSGWWPDVNCYGNYYYGNTMTRIADRGIYNEFPSNDSRIMYNAIVRCNSGITSRFAWHLMCMYNYMADNTNEGISLWGAAVNNPYLFDNVYAKNIVTGSKTCLSLAENGWLQNEKPGQKEVAATTRFRMESNLLSRNLYHVEAGGQFADFDGVNQYATLPAFQQATGMENGSRVVAQPNIEDLSLRLFTVRIPDSAHPDEAVPVVGNPVRQGIHTDPLPAAAEDSAYFWRMGDAGSLIGGGTYEVFGLNYQWPGANNTNTVRRLIRCDKDADPMKVLKPTDDPQVWLECVGTIIDKIPADGSGFWSPSLPTVPGAHIRFSFQLSGDKIKSAKVDGGPVAYIRFQTQTGQHVQRIMLLGTDTDGTTVGTGPLVGTFPWRTVNTDSVAPADAKRFAIFFGLKPAEGSARFANFRLDTPAAPALAAIAVTAARYDNIDLTSVFNRDLDKDDGGAVGAPAPFWYTRDYCDLPAIDLSKVKHGMHMAGVVPFQVSRAVSLRCSRRPPLTLPVEANGIAINRNVTALYFLHAGPTHFSQAREYWRYIVHYADGASAEVVPVRDTALLHYYAPYFLSDATAVQAAAPTTGGGEVISDSGHATKQQTTAVTGTDVGEVLRWVNPRPQVEVTSVDFRSMNIGQAVLLAITAAVAR
jgi:hypothetical protein